MTTNWAEIARQRAAVVLRKQEAVVPPAAISGGSFYDGPEIDLDFGSVRPRLVYRFPVDPAADVNVEEWVALTRWLADWQPPAKPFDLNSGVRVDDPPANKTYCLEIIGRNPRGQVKRALSAYMERLKEIFGG